MTWNASAADTGGRAPGPDDHDAPGTELAPGVTIERRAVLWVGAAAAAAALAGPGPLWAEGDGKGAAAGERKKDGLWDWDDFLARCLPVAREMVKDTSPAGQDAYLHRIASMAARLASAPQSKLFPFGKLDPKVEFGPSFRGVPFFVIQWRMHPRAVLPAHCHPGASVCTVGIEGEARLRNFEVFGEAPAFDAGARKAFLIRETHSQVLTPRRVSTLSATRDNIHYFEAGPDGARGLDVTTMFGGTAAFSFLAFDPGRPKDPALRTFEAVWTGQRP
jgi:hypothetical protein